MRTCKALWLGDRQLMLFAALSASAAHIHGMARAERHCGLRSPQRRSAAVMNAALHLATVDDAEDFLLSSMCSHSLESVLTLDDAPKLAHSIAIDLDDALAGAVLPISQEGSTGITLCGNQGRCGRPARRRPKRLMTGRGWPKLGAAWSTIWR